MTNKNNTTDNHLTEDQILMALVDESELGLKFQSHLAACPICNNEKIKIERRIGELSRMAKRMTQMPTRSIRLPETKSRSFFWSGWRLSPVMGIALATVLVLMVLWRPARFYHQPGLGQDMLSQEMDEDNQFMTEVEILVENALPKEYQDILAVVETEFEDDFMYYIVPSVEDNNSQSLSQRERGVIKC